MLDDDLPDPTDAPVSDAPGNGGPGDDVTELPDPTPQPATDVPGQEEDPGILRPDPCSAEGGE